ncbi:MAG: hypothetical protein FJ278_06100, partial [Planctomycetes bacterium]|nr:hypothetical protein [Planctomycetota bacterium]
MRRLVLAILLLMAAQPCFAVVEIGDALNTVTLAVETPHVKWAKPLAGGPLKALVIGPRFGMRDLAELGQRLDLTWTVVMAGNSKSWEGSARVKGCTEADALRALDRAVKDDYDLILIGNVHWGILPKPALYEVFKKVRDGAGLVYVPFEKTPPLLGELFEPAPAASSPQWIVDGAAIAGIECMKGLAGPVEFAGVLGRGRVVILRWPGGPGGIHFLTPGRAATYVDYEYCQQALARACLWACRRTPEKALTVALPETVEMVRASQVKLAAPPGSWRMAIRDAEGELEWEREGQSGEIPWPPALKLGAHFCDLWALRDAKVADFASRCFTVAGGVSVGEITFDKPFVEVGEQVQGTVKLAGEGQRPAQAEVSLFDIFKQEITRQRLKLPPGATSFTFAFSPVVSVATKHRVRVRLLDESDAAYAEKWADLLVPTRGYADMQVIGWAIGSGSWLTDLLAWQGRRRGFTASIFSGNLNAGIRGVPYTTSYRYTGLSRVESPCYTNPEDRRKEAEKLRDRARTHLPQGILAYSLGDENTLAVSHVDVCMSPTCQEDF